MGIIIVNSSYVTGFVQPAHEVKTKKFYSLAKIFSVIFFTALTICYPHMLQAGGIYRIGKDKGGIYMDTDHDGSWYIDSNHLPDFVLGETGSYRILADHDGTFIKTGKGFKYYIDYTAKEKLDYEVRAFNQKQRKDENIETKVNLLAGSHVLIPVTIHNNGIEAEIMMLLDTGASIMVIHKEIAEKLGLKSKREAALMVANGSVIKSEMVTLELVGVGPIQKKGVQASIIQYEGPEVGYRGLLGMNFIKGLDYKIDYERRVICWKP